MAGMSETKVSCPDCGEYPVSHPIEWLSALFDTIISPLTNFFEKIAHVVEPSSWHGKLDGLALPLFRFLTAIHFGTLKTDVDEHDSGRSRWLWDAANRKGITMHQFRILGRYDSNDYFVAQWHGKTIAFEGLPRPDRRPSRSLEWMDNKAILKKKFTAAGIPMARGRSCVTFAQAQRTMEEVGASVITKPHIGSRSRHATVGIRTREELRIGFERAQLLSPWVIVEQELRGYLFRVLLVEGKVAGIIRREQAHVVGNGRSTIRELAIEENKNPRRQGPTFHQLPFDSKIIDWERVPDNGEIVNLNEHISRYYGGSTTDFTERVHPDNLALFERMADVLRDSLVGVDFIIGDMEKSWREQKLCGVIECNSLPNIDLHHDVLYGKSRDIGGLLLELAFKNAENRGKMKSS